MRIKKLIALVIFIISVIFIAVGVGMYLMPLDYITINGVRQAATAENTRTFRLIFLSVFGGIGFVAFIVGVVLAVKMKRYDNALVVNY